jgi:N-acetyltransferase 10
VFEKRFPTIKLSYLQSAIMLSQGLQHKSIDSVAAELELPARQLLALFNKAVRKLRVLLFTVIFHANLAHSLTRSP